MTSEDQHIPMSLRVRQWVLSQPVGTRFTIGDAKIATGIGHGSLSSALHFLVRHGALRAVRSVREPGVKNRYTYQVLTGTDPVRFKRASQTGNFAHRGPNRAPAVFLAEEEPRPRSAPVPDDVIEGLGQIVPVPRPDPQRDRLVGVLLAAAGMAGATADDFLSAALNAEVSK